MKKILSYILIAVLLGGIFLPLHTASAANSTSTLGILGCIASGGGGCVPGILVGNFGATSSVFGTISYVIMTALTWVNWFTGILLNSVLKYTVLDMSAHLNGGTTSDGTVITSGFTGINIAWKTIKDLMNIVFIFLLVYEGIKMIIGVGKSNAKGLVVGIVTASLLINFSLFFTKVLIDASNLATIGFYNSMVGPDASKSASAGLSNPIQNALGVTGLYDPKGLQAFQDAGQSDGGGKMIIFGIGGSLILLITSFIFLAITVLFVVRYIVILILLMFSPVGYMGLALPFMKSYASTWWSNLKSQLLFAPLFMIMMWAILTLMQSTGFLTSSGGTGTNPSYAALFLSSTNQQPSLDNFGLILNFAVIIGLIIAALITAKNTATKGSALVGDLTGRLTKIAGATLMGGAAWAGRNTVGRAAMGKSSVEELETRAAAGSLGAKTRLAMVKGSYDVRRTSGFGTLEEKTGVRFGKGTEGIPFFNNPKVGEGGRAATLAKKEKETREKQSAINTIKAREDIIKGAKPGATPADIDLMQKALAKLSDKDLEVLVASNKKILDSKEFAETISVKQLEAINKSEKLSDSEKDKVKKNRFADIEAGRTAVKGTPAGNTAIDKMEQALSRMSDKETEILVASNKELLASQNFANTISIKQLEALNKSDTFSESEKAKLKDTRFNEIIRAMSAIGPAKSAAITRVKGKIKDLSDSELEMINADYLKDSEFVAEMKQSQVDAINKSNKFTSSQKEALKVGRFKPLNDALIANNDAQIMSLVRKTDAKTRAGYMNIDGRTIHGRVVKIALDPAVIQTYNAKILTKMADEMNDNDKQTLKDAIIADGRNRNAINWLNDPDKGGVLFI